MHKSENSRITDAKSRLLINTSVEQISDWLTKAIVGIGLFQLKSVPSNLERLTTNISGYLKINTEGAEI